MTRVTAPINKLARSLTSHPSVARPVYIANATAHSHSATSGAAIRADLAEREENNRRFTMTHRPTPSPVPSRNRTVPLMQTFRTSAPRPAQLDTSTIDYAVMPNVAEDSNDAGLLSLRVPLLPDNFFPDREKLDGHAPEAVDGPLAAPEIVVVAAHPENVTPASALTEIEGMGIDGVELKFAHMSESSGTESAGASSNGAASEPGMLRDLWKGLVDDLTGSSTPSHKAA